MTHPGSRRRTALPPLQWPRGAAMLLTLLLVLLPLSLHASTSTSAHGHSPLDGHRSGPSPNATATSATAGMAEQPHQASWLMHKAGAKKAATVRAGQITKISVIGERHSGTNFMKRLLLYNIVLDKVEISDWFCEQKHKYQTQGPKCPPLDATVVIVMFRNPYDWALAMHRQCFCGEPGPNAADELKMAALPFKTFLTQGWMDNAQKPWTGTHHKTKCKNVMRCRAYKIQNFMNISDWSPHVEHVRHEDVIQADASVAWLESLVERYALPTQQPQLTPLTLFKGTTPQLVHLTLFKGTMVAAAGASDVAHLFKVDTMPFDVERAVSRSVWFNKDLTEDDSAMRMKVHLITETMETGTEAVAGYAPREWMA
ncbi:hypothetical protein FOA52_000584 [Chlamydomonas sp. UWO 241]|nr:hypothetical protein FOA52_000584 [Chlamydomonas sp. UWO 241]